MGKLKVAVCAGCKTEIERHDRQRQTAIVGRQKVVLHTGCVLRGEATTDSGRCEVRKVRPLDAAKGIRKVRKPLAAMKG